jgi:hypothetical protein
MIDSLLEQVRSKQETERLEAATTLWGNLMAILVGDPADPNFEASFNSKRKTEGVCARRLYLNAAISAIGALPEYRDRIHELQEATDLCYPVEKEAYSTRRFNGTIREYAGMPDEELKRVWKGLPHREKKNLPLEEYLDAHHRTAFLDSSNECVDSMQGFNWPEGLQKATIGAPVEIVAIGIAKPGGSWHVTDLYGVRLLNEAERIEEDQIIFDLRRDSVRKYKMLERSGREGIAEALSQAEKLLYTNN